MRPFVEQTLRDARYALRTFRRSPLVTVTIILTVGLGLGLVAVAFTAFNALAFRIDAVPDVHEMVALQRPEAAGGVPQRFTRAELDALRRETNIFADAFAQVDDIDSRVDGQLMFGTYVTGNFFQVLRVNAAMGRTLTQADDERLAGRPVMVLSHRGWDRLFARDPRILDRRLLIGGVAFDIVGVMPEGFRGLTIAADDYWAPLSMLGRASPTERALAETGLDIVGRLKPGMSLQTAQAGLAVWDFGRANKSVAVDRGTSDIVLERRDGTVPQPLEAMLVVAPLFFAFGLILLIGCANVTNLLLARAVARQREIGIRLSMGATARRIVRQLLTENLLLAIAAGAAGFGISRLVLHALVDAVMTSMAADLGDVRLWIPDSDWRVTLFLIVAAGLSTMIFGLVPALHAARVDPIGMIRGEVIPQSNDARPGRARNFLVGLQVSASALLLICAAVFLRSAYAAATVDPGIRTSDTVMISIANEERRARIVQALATEPAITTLAAGGAGLRTTFAEAGGSKAAAAYVPVSGELFRVLDIGVVRGRTFMPDERTPDASVAVVSETAARTLWPNGDPLGQAVRVESRTFTVLGIVRDVKGFRFLPVEQALIYVPANAAMPGTSLVARVHGDPELARQALLDRLAAIDPDMARSVTLMRTVAGAETYFLELAFSLTIVLGGLALVLTLSGLFSVLSYLVEQRTREIGVRMALGATKWDVAGLVLSQSIRPVGFGLLAGGGAAAALAALLLSTPAAATIGDIVHVLDPVAYAVSLLIIVIASIAAASIPATRAARLNPSRTLRQQ